MIKQLWNKFSEYFGFTIIHPQFISNRLKKQIIREVRRYSKGNLVDIGCGGMDYKPIVKPLIKTYTGVDSPKTANLYKEGKPDVFASVEKLPFKDSSFNTVLLLQVLQYIEHPQAAFDEINRVLKKNGILIMSSPFMYSIHDVPFDRNRFTNSALSDFIKDANLKIVKIIPQGSFSDFLFLSILVFMFKSLKALLENKNAFLKLLAITWGLISVLCIIPLNLLSLISNLTGKLLPKLPSLFPVNYLVIAKKRVD